MNSSHSPVFSWIGLIIWSLYGLGVFYPSLFWTTNFLAFLPPIGQISLLSISLLLVLLPWVSAAAAIPDKIGDFFKTRERMIISVVTVAALVLMFTVPIANDYYGDAYQLRKFASNTIETIPQGAHDAFFSTTFSPWSGHQWVLSLVTYLTYLLGVTYGQAFMILDGVCGSLAILIWMLFLHRSIPEPFARILLALAMISAPFMLLFWGHYESYAPLFLILMAWVTQGFRYLETGKKETLLVLGVLLLLGIRIHTVALLLVPGLLLLYLLRQKKIAPNWNKIGLFGLIPIFAAGAILYFFIFQDHLDSRDIEPDADGYSHLFLPLVSPAPPLDRYNLLSFNHLLDYMLEIMIWAPVGILVLFGMLISRFRAINWQEPLLLWSGFNLIILGAFFFMVNPLLSMQMDWDMMAIPAPFLLIFIASMLRQFPEGNSLLKRALFPGIGIALLAGSIFWVETHPQPGSERLMALGIRTFEGYHTWSHQIIDFSLKEDQSEPERYGQRLAATIEHLQPYATIGNDKEYSRLLKDMGRYQLRYKKDLNQAIYYLNAAAEAYPREYQYLTLLMEANYRLQNFEEALRVSRKMIEEETPSKIQALRIATQCALEARAYEEAGKYAREIITLEPDSLFLEVTNRIERGDRVDSLIFLFVRSE